jgi:UDP:flavonoid glycosyltransferase YjiC (YdhE family)
MARVLICWELGANLGHLARQALVAKRLRQAGHEVLFAVRDLSNASAVLGRQDFRFVQAPIHSGRVRMPRPPVSYSELLLAEGYGRPGLLLGHITAWHALFDLYGAEAVIVDHAPTALLAAHARRMARVQVGCGFTIPPATQPFPRIRAWKDLSDEQLARSDAVVLRSINACLARIPGAAPLQHVSDLFRDAPACLATFPEIDHYGERQGAQYAGPLFGSANGVKVSWQSSQAPRVLSYLQNGSAGLRNMLKTFALSPAEVICAIPGIPQNIAQELSTSTLRIFPHPIALGELLEGAQAVVCHGGSGTSSRAFLHGVPLMALPTSIEQLMQVRRYEELGMGVVVGQDRSVEILSASLERLLTEPAYADKAGAMARKYQGFEPARVAGQVVALVEREVSPASRLN